MQLLKFSFGNAKLSKFTAIISLLAGHSCPGAKDCKSSVIETKDGNKIQDGEHTQFRCYAASSEALHTNVYKAHKYNFDLLKEARTAEDKVELIVKSMQALNIDTDCRRVRIHSSGDFFVQSYFDAWLEVARMYPEIIFYAYTKSLKFWVRRLDSIPANMKLTASYGGFNDELIEQYNLKHCKVVYSREEAAELNIPIDSDDSHAWNYDGNFAQLIHGTQPAGSDAAKAKEALKKVGFTGYNRKKKVA